MDDIENSIGGITIEWLEEKLIDFELSLDKSCGDEIVQKINLITTKLGMTNDAIVDSLIAFLYNVKKTDVVPDIIDDLEIQETAKFAEKTKQLNYDSAKNNFNVLQRSILKELPIISQSEFDDDELHFNENDFFSKNVDSYCSLSNIKTSYRGKLFVENNKKLSNINFKLKIQSNCSTAAYSYGSVNLLTDINEFFDLKNEGEEKDAEKNIELAKSFIGIIMPSEGRNLTTQNALLYTNSQIYNLDLDKIDQFAIFPGKKVKVVGNIIKNTFQVEKIENCKLPLQFAKLNRFTELEFLKICVACGPFSTTSDCCVGDNFINLLNSVYKISANVLILIGPFVTMDCTNTNCSLELIFLEYLQKISNFINLKKTNLRVLILPNSVSDINAMPYFPTPPYNIEKFVLHKNISLLPDPAIFDIEGVQFAISAMDIIMHLSKREVYKSGNSENEDRMLRLFSHIITNHSIYPLCPSDSSMSFSLKNCRKKIELIEKPHVLILPSVLQPTIKIVENCIAINPGKFIRGKSGGTFGILTIDLKSATLSAVGDDSIAEHSNVELITNTIP